MSVSLIEHFKTVLRNESARRNERQEWDTTRGEPLWVAAERQAMLDAVNTERHERGLRANVTESQIERVETSACGHIDYAAKYAIGCTDLVLYGKYPR